jgi:signal transduction histidine kinase
MDASSRQLPGRSSLSALRFLCSVPQRLAASTSHIAKLETFHRAVDWFIPSSMAGDKVRRKQARLFLLSHLLGPFLGNGTAVVLSLAEPDPGFEVGVILVAISGFWLFPFLLRRFDRLELLALISIENLTFCVLWVTYFYGGAASPFLPWTITIPLLAFFYVGDSRTMRWSIVALLAGNAAAFYLIYQVFDVPKQEISIEALQGLGILSTAAIGLYVTMMALYYARALASQSELEATMRDYVTTASALKHAAWKAERESAAKIEFLAKMSHELRTPLNAIIGYSQMLLEEAEDLPEDENVHDLQRIQISGEKLLKLVNNILDIARIDAGKLELYNEFFDANLIVESAIASVAALNEQNGNTAYFAPANHAALVLGDQLKFQSAIAQVIENAAKFTKGGRVSVTCSTGTRSEIEFLFVSVEDTGIGIESTYLSTLFEQYAAGDEHTSTKYGGTGLGLALARKLCRLMGGEIEVTTRIGEGSRFTLSVPMRAAAEEPCLHERGAEEDLTSDDCAAEQSSGQAIAVPMAIAGRS